MHSEGYNTYNDSPPAWNMTNYDIRTCSRAGRDSHCIYCDLVCFTFEGAEYSRVCGKTKAYQ